MSLISAMNNAVNGLGVVEKKISVTSNNITNADTPGYSKQTYTPTYFTSSDENLAIGGTIQSSVDQFLVKSAVSQGTDYNYNTTLDTYLKNYVNNLGSIDSSGGGSLSTNVNNFETGLSTLANDPTNSGSRSAVVANATTLAANLNQLSNNIQSARVQASDDISTSVTTINNAIDALNSLNKQIGSSAGSASSALVDERNTQLQTLSSQIGINYYIDNNNLAQVYTTSGELLLGADVNHLSYPGVATIASTSAYPATIPAITINGKDVTGELSTGKLGALVQLRDTTLPNEQAKLDALATTLQTTTNTLLNQGASIPPRTTFTGATTVAATDAFSGTGKVRIAITDTTGTVQSYTDLNLATLSSPTKVSDVVTALNGITGISASIDGNGHLKISATASGTGVSINELTSSVGGKGFSNYFGLNNMFDNTVGASDIKVSDYLQQNPSYLASGTLSSSSTLAAGDVGIAAGDASTINNIISALNGQVSFATAGNFSSQSNTIAKYVGAIISDVSTRSSSATSTTSTSKLLLDTINSNISSTTGVNIDEETANASTLSNAYNATAHVMSVVDQMFKDFLAAI